MALPSVSSRSLLALCAASLLALSACGSGGGGDSSGGSNNGTGGGGTDTGGGGTVTPTVTTAEGFWAGPTSVTYTDGATTKNYTMAGVVLENNEYWHLIDRAGEVIGLVYGKGDAANGKFTGTSGIKLNATYVTKTTFEGTAKYPNSDQDWFSYALKYDKEYENPPPFNFAGDTWVGSLPLSTNAKSFNISISSAGVVVGSSGDNCDLAGTLTLRPNSKRIYNASLTISGATCTLTGNQSVKFTGIGEPTANQGGTLKQRVLIKAVDDATRQIPLVILVDR